MPSKSNYEVVRGDDVSRILVITTDFKTKILGKKGDRENNQNHGCQGTNPFSESLQHIPVVL